MIEQTQSVTLTSNQKPVQLRINRLAIHHRMKILETEKSNGSKFYLFFYKDDFITGKSVELEPGSLMERAFIEGIVLYSPHPLISKFLENQTIVLKSTKHVLHAIQKKYSPQEISFIFSYFEQFLSLEKITQLQKKYFYEYRRNGQLRRAYQILAVALYANPHNKWAQEIANQLEFQKVKSFYEAGVMELRATDPLFAEIKAYEDLETNTPYLESTFKNEKRSIDLPALKLKIYINTSHTHEKSLPTLDIHLSQSERALLMWNLYSEAPHLSILRKQVFESLIQLKKTTEAVNLLTSYESEMTDQECELLIEALKDPDIDIKSVDLAQLQTFLCKSGNKPHLPTLLQTLIPKFLEKHEVTFLFNWLKPFYKDYKDLPILTFIQTMAEIQDDPDKQLQLGKLYHKLRRYDDAIRCFDWEMELHPTDPTPVQWLTKVYREMGKIEESNAYMSIYSQMQRATN